MPPPGDHSSPTASIYQPDLDACPSCVLYAARGGRRCPPAQEAYDLRALQDARNLEVLRLAVQSEVGTTAGLADLIQLESAASAKPTLALMPGAPRGIVNESQEKEVEYVPAGSAW